MSLPVLPLTLEEQSALLIENSVLRLLTHLTEDEQAQLRKTVHMIMNDYSEKRRLEDIAFSSRVPSVHPASVL